MYRTSHILSQVQKNILPILKDGNTIMWNDFTDESKITKDSNNKVSKIDPVINGLPFWNAPAGSEPLWNNNGILITGASNRLISNGNGVIYSSPHILYLVMKQTSIISGNYNLFFTTANGGTQLGQEPNTSRLYYYDGTRVIYDSNLILNSTSIIKAAMYDTSSSFISINNVKSYGSLNYPFYLSSSTLGNHPTENYPSNLQIMEIIVRHIIETTQNESDIYNYLKTKYNL